jgi:hypothetical protein
MLVAGVLFLAACGSESHLQQQPAPRLPRAVAFSLASSSDALASTLRRGDSCAARTQVHALERLTRSAITSGRAPAAYRQPLLTAVTQLAARVPRCVPAPPPAPPPTPTPKHGDDHKKPKQHGGEGD